MAKPLRELLRDFQGFMDDVVGRLLEAEDVDLDKPVKLKFGEKEVPVTTRLAIQGLIVELEAHRGQIAANQHHSYLRRTMSGDPKRMKEAEGRIFGRTEVSRLSAQIYTRGAGVIEQLIGYPDAWSDEPPKEGEWSIRQIVEHLVGFRERFNPAKIAEQARRGG